MQRTGCQLPTRHVFNSARTGNVLKETDLQTCGPQLAPSLLSWPQRMLQAIFSHGWHKLVQGSRSFCTATLCSGQAGPKALGDCVRLVLNTKLYPEIMQNNTNCNVSQWSRQVSPTPPLAHFWVSAISLLSRPVCTYRKTEESNLQRQTLIASQVRLLSAKLVRD